LRPLTRPCHKTLKCFAVHSFPHASLPMPFPIRRRRIHGCTSTLTPLFCPQPFSPGAVSRLQRVSFLARWWYQAAFNPPVHVHRSVSDLAYKALNRTTSVPSSAYTPLADGVPVLVYLHPHNPLMSSVLTIPHFTSPWPPHHYYSRRSEDSRRPSSVRPLFPFLT